MTVPNFPASRFVQQHLVALCVAAAASLAGCGGGDPAALPITPIDAAGGSVASLQVAAIGNANPWVDAVANATFHVAPVLLVEPDDADVFDRSASSRRAAHVQPIPAALAQLDSHGLSLDAMRTANRMHALSATPNGTTVPMASAAIARTYTPAQIRAAYGMPTLPVAGASLTADQAAQLGAGQTIYIVDAKHDPNAAAELAAFNQKFGLPGCTTQAIAAGAALPLAAASVTAGCMLSVVYATASGTMTATAPAYDTGWATEIALDVQWAHATAPLARIVLIEAADASVNKLLGAVQLANRMGPGVVSMSFGATEGNWTASVDAAFTVQGMSYLAATGDAGAAVSWPAVSTNVLAVGGTTLAIGSTGARAETAWSRTGGGVSQYTATASYQASGVPGVGSLPRRAVADVSFNADPNSGQYVALIPAGGTSTSWISAGGTSLSTPQWAGLLAVANAIRARSAKAMLGAPHGVLYGQIAAVPGNYARVFSDITTGSDGACATCMARLGYDPLTGLGTPNVVSLLSTLAGSTATVKAPVVGSGSVTGKAGTALSFQVAVTAFNPVTFALSGAPSGIAIGSSGIVSWANPISGSYAVTVTARDSVTGLSGQGAYQVAIAAASLPPVISANALQGVVGKSLSGSIKVSDPAGLAMTVSISNVPAGVVFGVSGQTLTLTWSRPVAGSYSLAITVTGSAGRSAKAKLPITIAAK